MDESQASQSFAYVTGALRGALDEAFAPDNETAKKTAITIVGSIVKFTMNEAILAIVAGAAHANIEQDLVIANILYEIHINRSGDDIRPAILIGLARRAYEARSLETLACVLSILANRPSTLIDVDGLAHGGPGPRCGGRTPLSRGNYCGCSGRVAIEREARELSKSVL